MRRALDETVIGGFQTDAGFLRWLVDDPAFTSGDYDTGLIADRWGDGPPIGEEEAALAAIAAVSARGLAPSRPAPGVPGAETAWASTARNEAVRR
jgi:acetyl/propionyl-CoA carboxylase alpha subunit